MSFVHITELKLPCGGQLPRAPRGPSLADTCPESASVGLRRGVGQGGLLESQTVSVTCKHSWSHGRRTTEQRVISKVWGAASAPSFKKQTAPFI